ncbi:AMP-binding protein [Ligilactobacillus sp. WILCCON 0076]|uniref:AMP-binding protein n=1 Tax=Ligilactobacillus ubinensis TaxID=2876789 RepID=A0A9X2FM24_9LACO|nr:AMP-binding protein [Ligilactobacillus ubinensis]MCP0887181.1 AMP-binding protein [Ligilactobacillus ubinensis]
MTKLTHDLQESLIKNANRPFLKDIALDRWFTGNDVEADIQKLQQVFLQTGLGRDDIVYMALANSTVYIPLNQALWRLGITAHPVSATTSPAELVADFHEHNYPAMIFNAEMAEAFETEDLNYEKIELKTFPQGLVFLSRKDIVKSQKKEITPTENTFGWILNTSGTTGKPKQVGLSHEYMRIAAQNDLESHRMVKSDTVLIVMPMFHINAQELIVVSTLLSGGRIAIAPKFSASRFWNWVIENDATWSSVVPTIVTILLKSKTAMASFNPEHKLRFVRCASAMLPVSRNKEFSETFGVPILEGYGMTEACSQCTLNPLDAIKVGSVGKPYNTEVAIIGEDDEITTKPGVRGEIVISGNHVIKSYLKPNKDSFRDKWFLTGDLGYFDEDGYLWLNGRKKYIINHGGEKVNPTLVEDVIGSLDFVKNVAVVPLPDEIYGEAVTAAIILQDNKKPTADLKQYIIDYAAERLAKYRRPTEIFFVDSFPLNPTGKIMRPQLSKVLEKIKNGSTIA